MDTWNAILTNPLSDKKIFPLFLQKRQKTENFTRKNSSKCYWGHSQYSLGIPVKRKYDKRPKKFRWMSEKGDQTLLSKTNDSPQNFSMVTLIAVLTTLPNKWEKMPSSFCSMSENVNQSFFRKQNLSQKVPTDLDNRILETLLENLGPKAKFFRSVSQSDKKIQFIEKNSQNFPRDT